MAGTTTYTGRVWGALYLKSQQDQLWWGIGHTSPWVDEADPPVPDPSASGISEIIGYRRAEQVETCILDDASGTLIFHDHSYTPISGTAEAYAVGANYVYVKSTFYYDELPVGIAYRQAGLYHGLIPTISGTDVVTSSGILDEGKMLYYANFTPTYRAIDKKDCLELVLEIR